MKATLVYTLPEDKEDFQIAVDGWRWQKVAIDLNQYLRTQLKYESDNYSDSELELLEKIRETLHQTIEDSGVSLN